MSKGEISVWDKDSLSKEIRETYGKNLTNIEFTMFMQLGKGLGADPFKREIWAVKYGDGPANIFCGRDFYRRKAQEQPDYNGHVAEAVYENDTFTVENGIPKHSYQLANRGKLIGAYCAVYRKNIDHPYYVFVNFKEYYAGHLYIDQPITDSSGKIIGYKKKQRKSGNSWVEMGPTTWDQKPDTMIKKVAEAQALRGAYQGVFRGTYDESEIFHDDHEVRPEKEIPGIVRKEEKKQEISDTAAVEQLNTMIQEALNSENPGHELDIIKNKWESFTSGEIQEQGLILLDTFRSQYE